MGFLSASKIAGLIAAALLIAGPSAAADKDMQGTTLSDAWHVVPVPLPPAPIDAAPGSIVLRQELQPKGLVRLKADLIDAGYGVTVPAGSYLFLVGSDLPGLYCTFELTIGLGAKLAHGMGGFPQLCAADTNHDGTLDAMFYKTAMPGYPPVIFGGRRPMRDIAPVAYGTVDPAAGPRKLQIAIGYGGPRGWDKRVTFFALYGTDDDKSLRPLSNYILAPSKDYPVPVEIAGARLTVDTVAEKGRAHITVARTMPEQDIVLGVH